jgi:integrase
MKRTMLSKVRAYLAFRRGLGFRLRSEGCQLMHFARYADRRGHRGAFTRQLATGWASLPKSAPRSSWARRLEVVRTFARYLLLTEPRTQIPPAHLFGPAHRRPQPHLYTPAQIQHLIERAGRLKGELRSSTWQTLIGLLACTGLRISEARRLKLADIDWRQCLLIIRESKRGRTRWVPLHPTAMAALRRYDRRRRARFPLAQHFFVSSAGTPLRPSIVGVTFRQLREGIPFEGHPPRLHDFRHTMASGVLQRWQTQRGSDVDHVLILSRFLGHSHLRHTYWYLSALPSLLRVAAQRFAPHVRQN